MKKRKYNKHMSQSEIYAIVRVYNSSPEIGYRTIAKATRRKPGQIRYQIKKYLRENSPRCKNCKKPMIMRSAFFTMGMLLASTVAGIMAKEKFRYLTSTMRDRFGEFKNSKNELRGN